MSGLVSGSVCAGKVVTLLVLGLTNVLRLEVRFESFDTIEM